MKNKKIIIIISFTIFLFLGNFIQKAEAWGYMIQIADRGVWTDYGTEAQCKAKLIYDTAAVTDCAEKNPTNNYIFTQVIGPINTTNNKIVGNSYTTEALCNTARTTYLQTTPGASSCYLYNTATYYVDPGVVKFDTQKEDPAPVTANTEYKLLAPIPGMDTAPKNIGDYFNIIFKIAIGICAVLAVVMIVIGGIQYMGDESVFGKTEAKSQITKAILGLLIAIGSYALLNTINPAMLGTKGVNIQQVSSEITPLYDRGANDPKQANGESVRCTPVTTANSPCTVANLTKIFGANDAVAMSKICNMESSGTNATSGTDVCKPENTPFSFGLFQVNLAAHGNLAASDCVGLFDKSVASRDAIEPKYTSGFSCKLTATQALYNKCKGVLLDPTKNLEIAKSLFTADKGAWVGDKKYCASAFK